MLEITERISFAEGKWMVEVLIDKNNYVFFKLRDPFMKEYWIPVIENEEKLKLPKRIKKIIYGE